MPVLNSAHCLTGRTGILIFNEDVKISLLSRVTVQGQPAKLSYCPKEIFGQNSGYFIEKNSVVFFLKKENLPLDMNAENTVVFVTGEFNHWQKNIEYALKWNIRCNAWMLKMPLKKMPHCSLCFKFVTALNQWIEPSKACKNISFDSQGNKNLKLDFKQTGRHWISFEDEKPLNVSQSIEVQLDRQTN